MPPSYVPNDAENIVDHGAVTNPTDPNDGSYSTNRQAIIDAATAAGRGGSIYVPEGTYYFAASGGSNSWIRIGAHTPAGISVYGDGPDKSEIALSQHHGDGAIGTLFDYVADEYTSTAHTVTWREVRLNGNYQNLPNLQDDNVGSLGINVRSNPTQDLELRRVHIYQTYNAGLRTADGSLTADYCTFEKCGFGVENDSGGSSIDHCTVPGPDGANGDTATFNDCEFYLTPGNAVDPANDGQIELYRCWGAGLGTGMLKVDTNPFYAENIYMRMNTSELENLVTNQSRPFDGRQAFYSMDGANPIELYDAKFEDMTEKAAFLMNSVSWEVKGDIVAFDGVGIISDRARIGAFQELDNDTLSWSMGDMSMHGMDASMDVFDTSNGGGSITTLNWDGGDTLGDTGSTTINTVNKGGSPVSVTHPGRSEVGYDAPTESPTATTTMLRTNSGIVATGASGVGRSTPLQSWTTIEDWSSGDFSNWGGYPSGWSIVQDTTVEGSNSAYHDSFNNEMYSHPTDHALSDYPSRGTDYRAHMILDATDGQTEGFGYLFSNAIPDNGGSGYDMVVDYANDAWELRRWDSGTSTTLKTGTASVSTGTLYQWYWTSDSSSVTCTVRDEDAGSEVISLTADDSNYDDQGIYVNNYSAAWNDLHEILK